MGFNVSRVQKKFEDFAYVLDFLSRGMMGRGAYRAEPMVQLLGESYFTLLEAIVMKMMAKSYEDRYSSVSNIINDVKNKNAPSLAFLEQQV